MILTLRNDVATVMKQPLDVFVNASAILEAYYKRHSDIRQRYESYMQYQRACIDYYMFESENGTMPIGYDTIVITTAEGELSVKELSRRIIVSLQELGLYFFLNLSAQAINLGKHE